MAPLLNLRRVNELRFKPYVYLAILEFLRNLGLQCFLCDVTKRVTFILNKEDLLFLYCNSCIFFNATCTLLLAVPSLFCNI